MKKCNKCGKLKPYSEFYIKKNMADGHLNQCKSCVREYNKKHRSEKSEYYREYDRKRYQEDPKVLERHKRYQSTEAGKSSMEKARKKWLENNQDKRAAHILLGNAVRDGRIEKPDKCQECSAGGRIHGHHEDYAKPLDVDWLCSKCHRKRHELEKYDE